MKWQENISIIKLKFPIFYWFWWQYPLINYPGQSNCLSRWAELKHHGLQIMEPVQNLNFILGIQVNNLEKVILSEFVKNPFTFFDKMVNKWDSMKIINLYLLPKLSTKPSIIGNFSFSKSFFSSIDKSWFKTEQFKKLRFK